MAIQQYALLGSVAYLLGSIPVALIVTGLLRRGDLRSIGSGNLGIYNTLFNVGKFPALVTIAANAMIGATAVVLARLFFPSDPVALFTAIVAVTTGSMWQIFVGFRGSRGTTVFGWAMVFSEPVMSFTLLGAWLSLVVICRRTRTATLASYVLMPVIFGVMGWSWAYVVGGAVLAFVLLLKSSLTPDDTNELGLFRRFRINVER